jgi:hypothetical protein
MAVRAIPSGGVNRQGRVATRWLLPFERSHSYLGINARAGDGRLPPGSAIRKYSDFRIDANVETPDSERVRV